MQATLKTITAIAVLAISLFTGNVFAATVCDAGDGPNFTVTNSGFADYLINDLNDPGLTVVRGCSYTFNVNAPGHPFLIKSAQGTGVANIYEDGVVNNGADNGEITWDVPIDAPDALFYNCQFHGAMTGTITVIDPPIIVNEIFANGFEA